MYINFVTFQNIQQSLMNRDVKIKTGMLGTLKIKETMHAVHTYILESTKFQTRKVNGGDPLQDLGLPQKSV